MEPPNETNPPRPPPSPSFLSLPKDIVLKILARISKSYYQTLSFVSKSFRSLILSDELDMMRSYMRSFIKLVFPPKRFFTTFQPVLPVTLRQTNEELSKLQATTDSDSSSVKELVNDIASEPLDQPQFPGSDSYDPWSNPVYNQFTTFPPFPISLGQTNGGFEFEALPTYNFKQYELWGPPQENNNQTANAIDGLWDPPQENNNQGDANSTIDGSFHMISRKPFDPIGRVPCNPFGPIGRPLTPFFHLVKNYM